MSLEYSNAGFPYDVGIRPLTHASSDTPLAAWPPCASTVPSTSCKTSDTSAGDLSNSSMSNRPQGIEHREHYIRVIRKPIPSYSLQSAVHKSPDVYKSPDALLASSPSGLYVPSSGFPFRSNVSASTIVKRSPAFKG